MEAMSSGNETKVSRPLIIGAGLLAAAHLPFVYLQCKTLWSLEYYQFFPFAFVMFAYLLRQRMVKGAFQWNRLNSIFVVIDVCLLMAGVILTSPFAVFLGAILLCFVAARSCFDKEYNCSLGYLAWLPLITVRPPLGYDVKVIGWLQMMTTKVSSILLDFFGYLHLRQGNVLEYPGKRFMVEEACSGVQSLFTVLFLGCLIVCVCRRRWLHTIIILFTAAGFAGLMNVLRICIVFIAWADYEVDISSGWEHDVLGYAALAVAGFLVYSADVFWGIVFDRVPDVRGKGISQIFRNPLIVFWNRIFQVRARGENSVKSANLEAQGWHRIALIVSAVFSISAITAQLFQLGMI